MCKKYGPTTCQLIVKEIHIPAAITIFIICYINHVLVNNNKHPS